MFDLTTFIAHQVTRRHQSMFAADIAANQAHLSQEIGGKSMLVIGGAGSIGSSYIRAILAYHPASLTVVDINENALAELTRDLRSDAAVALPQDYITYPMNYADAVFEKMFRHRGGFDIVANFSAHKHVRSEKDIYSVEALMENNLLRANQLLTLLVEYPPQHYFCVSTDKAANPVNIMGASKKMMEEMIMAYSHLFPVTTARFANVAFSNGSLPQSFLERIAKRQPLSAPTDVTRYFVSPAESGEICMLASVLGKSGEIFFPKLATEQMMTFSTIATALLIAMGYEVEECRSEEEAKIRAAALPQGSRCYPVYYSLSDTTGEKPYEEFFTHSEQVDMQRYAALGVVTNYQPRPLTEINALIEELRRLFRTPDTTKSEIVTAIKHFLITFDHQERGKSLEAKM